MYVLIHHDSQGFELVSSLLVPRETFVSCDLHGLYGYFKKSSYRMMRMMRMKSRVLRSKPMASLMSLNLNGTNEL